MSSITDLRVIAILAVFLLGFLYLYVSNDLDNQNSSVENQVEKDFEPDIGSNIPILQVSENFVNDDSENLESTVNNIDTPSFLQANMHHFFFNDGYPQSLYSLNGINEIIATNGEPFHGNFENVFVLQPDSNVNIELLQLKIDGVVTRNVTTTRDLKHIRIDFSGQENSLQYMTLFYYLDGMIKGKVYSANKNYFLEYNGEVGFLMDMNDYFKIEGTPQTD